MTETGDSGGRRRSVTNRTLRRLGRAALALLLGIAFEAAGAEPSPQPADFDHWLATFKSEARSSGISQAVLDKALADVRPIPRVIELDRHQPEFTQSFWTYMKGRVSEQRMKRGRELLKKHAALLQRIERRYGVQPRFLVAFWGLESNFGDYLGGFPVIGALTTLAFDPRRSDFFRAELLAAIRVLDQGHVAPQSMKGSWAGAMGQCQFLPSTFLRFGQDGDGDGKIDIWKSLPDVFASAANFLSRSGWKGDQTWGREVMVPDGFDYTKSGLGSRQHLAAWQATGVRRMGGANLPRVPGMEGSLLLPAGYKGPGFLVYGNFRTTMVWNASVLYALSVGVLADRLAGLPDLRTPRPANVAILSRDEMKEMQGRLAAQGFDAGPIDGVPGGQTRVAVRAFQQSIKYPADGFPSPDILATLRRLQTANGVAATGADG